jgi:hypothetical protein
MKITFILTAIVPVLRRNSRATRSGQASSCARQFLARLAAGAASFALLAAQLPAQSQLPTQPQPPAEQGAPQTTPARRQGPPLPPDDRALYRLFFSFYDGLSKAIESSQQQNPATGVKTQKGAAAHLLKISESDMVQVADVSRSFVTALAQLDSERKNYAQQVMSQHQRPEPAKLQAFDLQRRQLTDDTVQRLISSLPAESWKEVHSFINNQFRMQTGVKHP